MILKKLQRTCLVSKKKYDKKDLLRFYVDQNNILQLDIEQKQLGRGFYLKLTSDNIALFIRKKNFFIKKIKCIFKEDLINKILFLNQKTQKKERKK